MEALRVGVHHDNVPESGEHLRLLRLHHDRRIHSYRAEIVRCGGDGGVSDRGCRAVLLTLDRDVSNASTVVTHLHVERVQHCL